MTTFNALLGLAIFLTAAGSIKCMDHRTPHSVRAAIIGVGIGGLGQSIGIFSDSWGSYLDTLLFGGILALMIANRRAPNCVMVRWANPIALVVCIVTVLAVVAGVSIER